MSKLQFAKDIIIEAEEIGIENLPTLAELKEWANKYNNLVNEGGEGYVPDVKKKAHIEKYEWALGVVAELEPTVEEIVEVEEVKESNKQNVMSKAWEIARAGVVKFGGKVKEYFAESLRMAWAIIKNEVNEVSELVESTFRVNRGPRFIEVKMITNGQEIVELTSNGQTYTNCEREKQAGRWAIKAICPINGVSNFIIPKDVDAKIWGNC